MSAVDKQTVRNELQALDDEALVEKAARLRALMPPMQPKLEQKIDSLIAEATADLRRRMVGRGRRDDARGRLRSFCLTQLTPAYE